MQPGNWWPIAALSALLCSAACGGTTLYVDDDAPGDPGPGNPSISDPLEDGSPQHPFDAIQEAINASTSGDDVVVAAGTYTGLGNRDLDYGGRLITVRGEAGPQSCIINCQGGLAPQDWHRGFLFHSGETAAAVLDGFTIRNGSVGGFFPVQSDSGGGIRCNNASPTIANCIITQCHAYAHDCCAYGGGIAIFGGSPAILNCVISNNSALTNGGGIFGGSLIVIGCTIANNTSGGGFGGAGGGIYASTLTVIGCDIIGNSSISGSGGGIYASTLTVIGCDIIGNSSSVGGGIYAGFSGSTLTVINSRVLGNHATYDGGGLSVGANGLIANCLIAGNGANPSVFYNGGGGVLCGGSTTISNCTVVYNSAGTGGGIKAAGALLRNSIVWGNTGNQGTQLATAPTTVLTVAYCDIQPGPSNVFIANGAQLILGAGNIGADPMFVDADGADNIPGTGDDDPRLMPGSPCIDAGSNWAAAPDVVDLDGDGNTSELIPLDLDGNSRFAAGDDLPDTGCGTPVVVDMGAYETQHGTAVQPVLGDLTGDLIVGINDLLNLLATWGPCSGCCLGDLNDDGTVGITDFLALLANWS